jgi:glycosyltransferase involved in cell wall biosynthesis
MNPTVMFVTPWLHDGGIERNLEVKAPWFVRRGYRVAVASWHISRVLAGRPNPVLETLHRSHIPVIELTARRPRHQLLQRAVQLAHLCAEHDVDVIVGHETLGNAVSLAAKLLRRGRCRVIAEFHNAMIYPIPGFGPLMAACVRQLYRFADAFVAVSDGVGQEAADFFRVSPERVRTVYNPFQTSAIRAQAAAPSPLPLPAEPFIVGCGRLVAGKAFDDLIGAFSAVRRRRRLKLVILGEGPQRAALEACARAHGVGDDVLLPGFVSNPFAVFSRAAAFVLSSRFGEAFSRVLVEAMACGIPVIASRCRWGPEEVLGGGRYGRLYDVGAVDQLVAALEDVLSDPARARELVSAGYERVAQFGEDEILPRLEQVYFDRRPAPPAAPRLIVAPTSTPNGIAPPRDAATTA